MQYSKETNILLAKMYPNNCININCFPRDTINRLFEDGYIANSDDFKDKTVHLTDFGKAYIEQLTVEYPLTPEKRIIKWLRSNILEIAALIISIIALLKP